VCRCLKAANREVRGLNVWAPQISLPSRFIPRSYWRGFESISNSRALREHLEEVERRTAAVGKSEERFRKMAHTAPVVFFGCRS
jgi:hypothetical protein